MKYDEVVAKLSALSREDLDKLIGYIESNFPEVTEAKWTQAYINSLPDSSFLLVRHPVKDKAKDRALPVKDSDGKVDAAHLRNALARINQVQGFSAAQKATAQRKAQALAKRYLKSDAKSEATLDDLLCEFRALRESLVQTPATTVVVEQTVQPIDVQPIVESAPAEPAPAEVVEQLVETMVAAEVISADEAAQAGAMLAQESAEVIEGMVAEVEAVRPAQPVTPVGRIEDPTAKFDEVAVETTKAAEATTESTERQNLYKNLVEAIKRGDQNAERRFNRMLEDELKALKCKRK